MCSPILSDENDEAVWVMVNPSGALGEFRGGYEAP